MGILPTQSKTYTFILDSKDNFVIEATVASGDCDIYVGLDPDTVGPDNHLWSAKTEGSLAYI